MKDPAVAEELPLPAHSQTPAKVDAPPRSPSRDDGPAIRSGKLAGRSLWSAIFIVALPVWLEQFANAFVGLADTMLTGHLPEAIAKPALDGVGIASYIRWFTSVATSAIGVGGMALISRGMGGGNREQSHRALGQVAAFSVIWGAFIAGFLVLLAPFIARLAGLSDEGAYYCNLYIRTIAFGLPATCFLFAGMMCLHGAGETMRPFYIMIVVNIVNLVSSWYLSGVEIRTHGIVIPNPSPFEQGVFGIALGTVISTIVGGLLMLAIMRIGVKDLRLEWAAMKPDLSMLWRIVRIGVPNFFEGIGMWAGQMFAVVWVIGMIAETSDNPEGLMGAHTIAINWEAFSFMPGFALGVAAGSIAGQYLGAGNPRMAARSIMTCASLGMVFMSLAGLGLIFFGRQLTSIISDDPMHLDVVPKLLLACGLVQPMFALGIIVRNGLRGVGDTKACMVLTWFSTYCVRAPLAWIFGYFLGLGLVGVWIGLSVELVVRGLLFFGRFLQGSWKNIEV